MLAIRNKYIEDQNKIIYDYCNAIKKLNEKNTNLINETYIFKNQLFTDKIFQYCNSNIIYVIPDENDEIDGIDRIEHVLIDNVSKLNVKAKARKLLLDGEGDLVRAKFSLIKNKEEGNDLLNLDDKNIICCKPSSVKKLYVSGSKKLQTIKKYINTLRRCEDGTYDNNNNAYYFSLRQEFCNFKYNLLELECDILLFSDYCKTYDFTKIIDGKMSLYTIFNMHANEFNKIISDNGNICYIITLRAVKSKIYSSYINTICTLILSEKTYLKFEKIAKDKYSNLKQ